MTEGRRQKAVTGEEFKKEFNLRNAGNLPAS
jgi:hypothetical protein